MIQIKAFFNKFLKNKNTVTILCVIGACIILYIGYNYRINQATRPISVPYAKVEIQPRTLITEDMIGMIEVSSSVVTGNTATSIAQVIGMYSNYNTVIPAGSLFYTSTLVTWDDMPDSAWADIPDGYTVVSLPVDTETTMGNSIYPGNYIDLYYVDYDDQGKLLLGKLIESIEVLSVKDGNGNYVFENSAELREPAYLIFSVPEELHLLLRKASYLSGEIVPVQRNADYSENPSATIVSSEYLEDFILSQTVVIPENELPELDDSLEDEDDLLNDSLDDELEDTVE
ncbi:MAG: hypothetical protein IJB82_00250 [Bacilli bacterium]|nr:hypothetical protein [Bacilli bacterium]